MKFEKMKKGLKGVLIAGGICAVVPAVAAYAQGVGVRQFEEWLVPTEARLKRGAAVYERNCAACHGARGAGNSQFAGRLDPPPPNFTSEEWAMGPIQAYNVISRGIGGHSVFNHLMPQDRWAVTHYVRSLGPNQTAVDPPELVEQARYEAEHGICEPEVKETVADRVAFKGEEQLELAESIYTSQCASCHGEDGGGDGPAAGPLQPPPRDLTSTEEEWTKGTSPLAIFDTLTRGIDGTAMASFAALPEEERWALTHYVRERFVPDQIEQEATEEEITAVCRTLSQPPKPDPIPVESAMQFMVEGAPQTRELRWRQYGPVFLDETQAATRGEQLFNIHCASCHGPSGVGVRQLGPYGSYPPFLYLSTGRLEPATAGGTYRDFAQRAIYGVHVSMPDTTGLSHLSQDDWKALQGYVAGLPGAGEVRPAAARPAPGGQGDAVPAEGAEGADAQEAGTPGAPTQQEASPDGDDAAGANAQPGQE